MGKQATRGNKDQVDMHQPHRMEDVGNTSRAEVAPNEWSGSKGMEWIKWVAEAFIERMGRAPNRWSRGCDSESGRRACVIGVERLRWCHRARSGWAGSEETRSPAWWSTGRRGATAGTAKRIDPSQYHPVVHEKQRVGRLGICRSAADMTGNEDSMAPNSRVSCVWACSL
jgi:hypothetical protein